MWNRQWKKAFGGADMLKINQIWLLLVLASTLTQCATPGDIPSGYLTTPRKMAAMPNGCWVVVEKFSSNNSLPAGRVSGELIAVQRDTLFLLTQIALVPVLTSEIKTADLYLFKNQSNTYLLITGLGLLPNIVALFIGSPVFIFGIPFAITGIVTSAIENNSNTLKFPNKNNLNEFKYFARFPQGIPIGIDIRKLTLK